MTIVEIIDHFNGFQTIKKIIKTRNKSTLLWLVCALGFILSAIYDFKKTIDLLLGNTIAIPSMESGNFSNNLSAMDSKNEVIPYALIFWSLYIPGISLY